MLLERKVAELLIRESKTLAVAESCTGGLLSQRLTSVPGSSAFLLAGIVAYSNAAKTKILKIPPKILQTNGAVSEQVAQMLSASVRELFQTDFGISITGIAGPSGGSKDKPVGLTYIAIDTKKENLCLQCVFAGDRKKVREQAATLALELLLEFLQ